MDKKAFEAILKSGLNYVRQADPTMVVCASILALGMVGAGVAMGLLARRGGNTTISMNHGSVYKTNSDNTDVSGYKAKNQNNSPETAYEANDTAAMTIGNEA